MLGEHVEVRRFAETNVVRIRVCRCVVALRVRRIRDAPCRRSDRSAFRGRQSVCVEAKTRLLRCGVGVVRCGADFGHARRLLVTRWISDRLWRQAVPVGAVRSSFLLRRRC